jgi:protein TonB
VSVLAACVVYTSLGAGLMVAAREATPFRRVVDVVWSDPRVIEAEPPPARPVAPATPAVITGNGGRPADADLAPRPVDTGLVPATPDALPTLDRGHAGQFSADMPIMANGTGRIQEGPTAAVAEPAKVVELEEAEIRILHQEQPNYPAIAQRARIQGSVVLLMTVDAAGVPTAVQVLSGPHPTLQLEAMRVARLWRFAPARINGQAVPAHFRLTVGFRLS